MCDRGERWQQAVENVESCIDDIREIAYEFGLLSVSSPKEDCDRMIEKAKNIKRPTTTPARRSSRK